MSDKTRTNPKPQYGAQAGKRGLLLRFTIFMAWVAGIGLLLSLVACSQATVKPIASDDNSGYYIDLLKIESGKPSRDILAFFVPDNSAASQAVTMPSSAAPHAPKNATRGQTIISMANHLPADYDGKTSQNKTAIAANMRGSFFRAKSDSCLYPFSNVGKALTQKSKGGHHNA
ncbi:hypothetical protein ACTXIZ_11345 [Psychrobacter celer]|uniref:hypothetical protein n=1 Tax=Psychrobacter celer TaxID=306572 RepID=UPI003FD3F40C